ncbi:C/D box methylation guide ribonucleoprotein complex aNOP56 subunit [Candidatus Heimdallarchaeota archaeon B3_Heim]|nr:MAG: C/D box methylation guide ribonucleoprotein complex aNOP56 subunit [Candidatus Heimdallarchaeota archaeon B3_Heim]
MNYIIGCVKLKGVLVSAAGVIFGEMTSESTKIFDSVMFTNIETILTHQFKVFLHEHEEEIRKALPDITEEIVSDNAMIVDHLREIGYDQVRFASTGEFSTFRTNINAYLVEKLNLASPTDLISLMRKKSLVHTQTLLRENVEARDKYLAQAINSIDDINSILNLIFARLSEWYGIHFPELQELVRDNNQYIRLVSKMQGKLRSEIATDEIVSLSERRQELIHEAAEKSLGAEISTYDMNPISNLASFGVEILNTKETLEKYIEESMKEVAPNLQLLVGSLLGARLISLVGSLENLAKRSSGTIQVLGAEKALFRHLRSGEDPPKHGVIFQSQFIHSAKMHQRGKIARALAGKLSIAARVDFFSGEFIAPTLLKDLEKRIDEIKESFPEPSEKQRTRKQKKKDYKPRGKRGKPYQKGSKKSGPRKDSKHKKRRYTKKD